MTAVCVSDAERLNRKKKIILWFGVVLMFFTSMSKVLVPGPVYQFLLTEMNLTPSQIAGMGAAFMYSYAASQFLIGIYSNRYGGVRILLIGGSLFSLGMLLFPFLHNVYLLYFVRCLTGFGAGIVFIGNAKLLADLFPVRFALALGVALFVSYLGPVTGTVPFVWLMEHSSWRFALFLPGLISLIVLAGIILLARGTIKKTVSGSTIQLLKAILSIPAVWILYFSAAIIYGIYYALLTQIGQKCFQDFYHWTPYLASLSMTILTLIVAFMNILITPLLKLSRGNTKPLISGGMFLVLTGCLLGFSAFYWHLPAWSLVLAYILISIPAGYFSLFSLVAKELNVPENTGLAVALLNFAAFVFIALYGNLTGWILDRWKSQLVNGVFPGGAYEQLFLFLSVSGLIAMILSFFIPNIKQKKSA